MSNKIVLLAELKHHGILGQKWGVRRFQNYNGTLIEKGKANKALSDKADLIKAGEHVYRISTRKKENDIGQTFMARSFIISSG